MYLDGYTYKFGVFTYIFSCKLKCTQVLLHIQSVTASFRTRLQSLVLLSVSELKKNIPNEGIFRTVQTSSKLNVKSTKFIFVFILSTYLHKKYAYFYQTLVQYIPTYIYHFLSLYCSSCVDSWGERDQLARLGLVPTIPYQFLCGFFFSLWHRKKISYKKFFLTKFSDILPPLYLKKQA